MNNSTARKFIVSDILCGLGGGTEGCHQSDYATVHQGLNHDEIAIAINKANHPKVNFITGDLYKQTAADLYPCEILVAGIECTNHSNAKGGTSRDQDSRAMANELFRYSEITGCKMMVIENVREFKAWGPLIKKRDKSGKIVKEKRGKKKGMTVWIPDPKKKGQYFEKWKYKLMNQYGFTNYGERILCAADYGAATIRKRLFMIFAKPDWNIEWPKPTHSKVPDLRKLKPWVPCKNFIDLNNHGKSIFGRKRKDGTPCPLKDKTLARIAYGIKKYCLNNKQFIMKYYGTNNASSVDGALHTIRTKDCHALVTTEQFYIQNYHNTNSAGNVDNPLQTIVTKDEKAFITVEKVQFIDKYLQKKHNVSDINEPLGTITTERTPGLTTVQFLQSNYSRKTPTVRSIDEPARTLTSANNPVIITAQFLAKHFGGNHASDLNAPIGTITTVDHNALITTEIIQFVVKHFGQSQTGSIEDPLNTITAQGSHNSLISLHIGNGIILLDIKMRWLSPRELASCQGFPETYILEGTQGQQKRGIGNSIPPQFIRAIMNALGKVNQDKLTFI